MLAQQKKYKKLRLSLRRICQPGEFPDGSQVRAYFYMGGLRIIPYEFGDPLNAQDYILEVKKGELLIPPSLYRALGLSYYYELVRECENAVVLKKMEPLLYDV